MSVDTDPVEVSTELPPALDEAWQANWLPLPATVDSRRVLWGYVIPVVGFHLLLPLAFVPWLFSWTGLIMVPLGNYLFCSLGIGAGYHRLLTHRGYKCPRWLERTLALAGVCCLQDAPARWVAIHRMHHHHSDEQPDPHTPWVNIFWGHVGWLFVENRLLSRITTYDKYARDVIEDPFYMRLERGHAWTWVYLAHAVLFYLIGMTIGWISSGTYMGGVQFGLSLLLWAVIFRTIYTWHVTWGINSVCHRWGYRRYDTHDDSRNNVLFGILTNGEGFHNNHHAEPRAARHGHRWWELDCTYLTICLWERMGLVWDVVRPRGASR